MAAPQQKMVNRPAPPQPATTVARSPLRRGRAQAKAAAPVPALQSPYIARFRDALAKVVVPPSVSRPKKAPEPPPPTEGAAPEAPVNAAAPGPLAKTPTSPAEDPLFQKAGGEVRSESKRQRRHAPAAQKRKEVADASALEPREQEQQNAKETNTAEMERIGSKQQSAAGRFDAQGFKAELMERVNKKKPRDEGEAKKLAKEPPLENFERQFAGNVAQEQANVTGPLEEKAVQNPGGGKAEKPIVAVPKAAAPPVPRPVDPKLAAAKPKAWWEISLQRESDRLDEAMRANRLSDQQLADSREPSFIETLKVKQQAQKKVAEAPQVYRQREAAILQVAQARGGQALSAGLEGMRATQGRTGGQVFGGQKKTETDTEKRQREIKGRIDGFYEDTVREVKDLLKKMAEQVTGAFAAALKAQTELFNKEVARRISDYYGDWRIDDDLFGPDDVIVDEETGKTRAMTFEEKFSGAKRINPDVYRIFVQEKDRFLLAMDQALTDIANNVQTGLTAAHNRIRKGDTDIADFKETLSGEERVYADGLEQEVKMKFEALEASIDDAREDLLQTMADQYRESVDQLEKTFNEINDELKKGWLERAAEFIKTVGKTIFQLADLLLTILSRMAGLIWDIIKHPIRFFETLVAGLKQGIGQFVGGIGTYLQEAFWSWITKATPSKNIRLSASSGVEGLFDLVVQVLNLGPADLRASVEKVLGKEFMQMIDKAMALGEKAMAFGEKALEPVAILFSKGPGALWEYIKDQLGGIIRSSFDRIRESVFNTFVEKALKWIAGFFIPGGGFVKIVKAIFRAFQFVAENLERIRHFFDSVFDSMEAATQGRTEGVASKIITGLKTGIVLALDFLAKQLGLDKIVDGVQKIIQSIRRPILSAIEWVLGKVKPFVAKVTTKGKELVAKALGGDPNAPPEQRLQSGVNEAVAAVNRLSGSRVGIAVIRPVLGAIRLRHRMQSLEAVAEGGRWVVDGLVNPRLRGPTAKLVDTSVTPGAAGAFPSRIQHGALRSITYGKVTLRVGTRMTADPVGPDMRDRGTTVPDGPRDDLAALIGPRQSRYRVGHLLNHHIGGSGTNWLNLTPLSSSGNALHFHRVEAHVRGIVEGKGANRWVFYDVVPRYGTHSSLPSGAHAAERQFATELDIQWQPMEPDRPNRPTQLRRAGNLVREHITNELPS